MSRPRLPGSRSDWLLAVGFAAAGATEVALRDWFQPEAVAIPAAMLSGLALGLRRATPLLATAIVAILIGAQDLTTTYLTSWSAVALVEMLIVTFSAAAYLSLPRAIAGGLFVLAATSVAVVVYPEDWWSRWWIDENLLVGVPGPIVAAWAAGRAFAERRRRARAMEERAVWLARTREADTRAAVAEERARIARELHDAVAHTVSVMGVQAAAADQTLDVDPNRARESLRAIEARARESVIELQRLLGVLRRGDEAVELAPQPGLAELDALVEQVRGAGVEVDVRRTGTDVALSPGTELAVYRVVQEALTNVVKHSRANWAGVAIHRNGRSLEIEVTDDGTGSPKAQNGHGLIGMRERVALYGGSLDAGPRPEGGWRVLARLVDTGGRA